MNVLRSPALSLGYCGEGQSIEAAMEASQETRADEIPEEGALIIANTL